jgi:signal transduction histidine kinase
MSDSGCSSPGRRLWPPGYLKYLLVWPAISAYRRKTRTRLAWRLAGSHFAIVLWSVLAISVLVLVAAGITFRQAVPAAGEASVEANEIAMLLDLIDQETTLSVAETNALLKSLTTGAISMNYIRHTTAINATVGPNLDNIRSISVVDPAGTIISSSDPSLVGQPASTIDPGTLRFLDAALADSTDLDQLGGRQADGDGIIGTYALEPTSTFPEGGAIVVDKFKRTLPETLGGLVKLGLSFIGQMAVVLLLAVGLPAIPIGIVIGIRRARAISRPISDLARAGQALTDGDLSARVTEIKGDDEVALLQRGFNAMAESFQIAVHTEAEQRARAEQALAAKRDLIANVSHELRTPVALIRGHLESLESDPADLERAVRVALRETDRLEQLVNELFELSRLESRQTQVDLAPFDAGAAVRAVADAMTAAVHREAGLSLKAEIADGDLRCSGDRLRFEQVLLNLVRNAVRYTPEGGIILISAARDGQHVAIVVRDTGMGIAGADLPHIFDRFYRADQSRARATGGAGLGLAIARELVEAMGGTIGVESELDEGTAFTIRLPAATPATNGTLRAGSGIRL